MHGLAYELLYGFLVAFEIGWQDEVLNQHVFLLFLFLRGVMVPGWPVLDDVLDLRLAEWAVSALGSAVLAYAVVAAGHQDIVAIGRNSAYHAELIVIRLLGHGQVLNLLLALFWRLYLQLGIVGAGFLQFLILDVVCVARRVVDGRLIVVSLVQAFVQAER